MEVDSQIEHLNQDQERDPGQQHHPREAAPVNDRGADVDKRHEDDERREKGDLFGVDPQAEAVRAAIAMPRAVGQRCINTPVQRRWACGERSSVARLRPPSGKCTLSVMVFAPILGRLLANNVPPGCMLRHRPKGGAGGGDSCSPTSTLDFVFEPFHFGYRDHRISKGRIPIPTKGEVGSNQMCRQRGRGVGERRSGRTWCCWRAFRACCGALHCSRGVS